MAWVGGGGERSLLLVACIAGGTHCTDTAIACHTGTAAHGGAGTCPVSLRARFSRPEPCCNAAGATKLAWVGGGGERSLLLVACIAGGTRCTDTAIAYHTGTAGPGAVCTCPAGLRARFSRQEQCSNAAGATKLAWVLGGSERSLLLIACIAGGTRCADTAITYLTSTAAPGGVGTCPVSLRARFGRPEPCCNAAGATNIYSSDGRPYGTIVSVIVDAPFQ